MFVIATLYGVNRLVIFDLFDLPHHNSAFDANDMTIIFWAVVSSFMILFSLIISKRFFLQVWQRAVYIAVMSVMLFYLSDYFTLSMMCK